MNAEPRPAAEATAGRLGAIQAGWPLSLPGVAGPIRRLLRGRPADPVWSRPGLIGVVVLAGLLMLLSVTRSGYANTYYASAVYAGTKSWSALWHNALDTSQYVAVDKTPLSIWMMAISGRVLGFSSFSMLLPNALCAMAAVGVLHGVVRRSLGATTALLAALLFALTPAVVVVGRFNNPDALLMLLLVCAAWAAMRGLESGRTRDLVLCGVLVGLAFNTKMLQAYLIVPALGLALLIAGRGSLRRRLGQLAVAGVAMGAVSFAWVTAMMLTPAAQRPFVGDTTSNSWWDLIFNANGLDRTAAGSGTGPGSQAGFGGGNGLLRLFNDQVGGQIAWLLPLALVGLLTGLWLRRRAPRTDIARAAHILWGTWLLVHVVVFSLLLNLFHPYYTSALAPAVAVLAAAGVVALASGARSSRIAAATLAAALAVSAWLAFELLGRAPGFVPWLRWVVVAAALVAIVVLALRALGRRGARLAMAGLVAGLVALAAGPAAFSIATVGQTLGGGNPVAGPAVADGAGFGAGPAGLGNLRPPASLRGGLPFGPPPAARRAGGGAGGPGGPGTGAVDRRLLSFLTANRGTAKYLVAATGSQTAAPIMLATHQPVVTIGGFMGSDPTPTVAQLRRLVASGQLRYVLLGGFGGGGFGGGGPGARLAPGAANVGPGGGGIPAGALFGGPGGPPGGLGAPGGRGGPGGGAARAATAARSAWVTSNCQAVNYTGATSAAASATGQGLYDCSRAAAR